MPVILIAFLFLTQAATRQTFFATPYPPDQMKGQQAVVETDVGTFVIQLLPGTIGNISGVSVNITPLLRPRSQST